MAPGKLADLLQKHRKAPAAGATGAKRARRASEGQSVSASPPPVAAEESSNEEPPADTLPQTTGGESGEEASDLEPEGGGSEGDVGKARLNERKKLKEGLANDPRAKARAFANAMFKPRA